MVRTIALQTERKRLDLLEKLKAEQGPFTNAEKVKDYMDTDVDPKVKQIRLKKEVQFARNSSTTLPRVDPMFKVQVTLENKKRRDKTSLEIAETPVAYLGKKADRAVVEYELISKSKISVQVRFLNLLLPP